MQPGFVFWTGLADEERIDGNLGIAYRTGLMEDVIGGASVFYDRDFKQGHSRISFGADVQSGFFHGAANYYQPLSDEEDGREGFVEEALRGMDFQLAFQRDVMRVSGNLGYWRFEGDADWKISYGLDAGVRVFPGVFLEGGWERHDEDLSLDSRWNAGLAFRFSLPDFKGASYGDGSMSSNLYRIVEREKRILYEERVEGPSVSIARVGSVGGNLREDEDNPVSIRIQLNEALEEDVTLNLVGGGTATYGADNDWEMSVGGTNCASVAGTGCQIMIFAGETTGDDVVISINEDGRGESSETIILSVEIASAGDTDLTPGSPLVLIIAEDLPLPSVSLSATNTGITEGAIEVLTITLSEAVSEDITLNLVGSGTATYGTSNDWHLHNGTSDCDSASGMSCQVTISAGSTTIAHGVNISVLANTDSDSESPPETAIVSVQVDSGSANLVQVGSQSSLIFNIQDPMSSPTVSLNYSGNVEVSRSIVPRMTIELSEALSEDVTLNIVGGGTATYGTNPSNAQHDWRLVYEVVSMGGMSASGRLPLDNICPGVTGSSCQVTISAGSTIVDLDILIFSLGSNESISVEVVVASAGSTGLEIRSPTSQMLNY